MASNEQIPVPFISAALTKPSWSFTYRFVVSVCLWLVMFFSLTFRYSKVSFFILVLINMVFCADIFIRCAWKDLCKGRFGLSSLVTVCVGAGFIDTALQTFLIHPPQGLIADLYLYASFFLTLALWVQSRRVWEREKAQVYIKKIDDFLPKSARKCQGNQIRKVFASELKPGDQVLVKPGERLPCDGILRKGKTAIDEQLLTGNALAAYKQPGEPVYAGTVNKSADIYIEVTHPLASAELMGVVRAVQNSERRRSFLTTGLDVVSGWVLLGLLLVTAGQYGFMLLHAKNTCGLACLPWVWTLLSLGAPFALLAAQGTAFFFALRGAKTIGIHIQNRHALAQFSKADTVFFDKTGTLTYGKLTVHRVEPVTAKNREELLQAVACAEEQVDSPFAVALMQYIRQNRVAIPTADGVEVIPGIGVRALRGKDVILSGRIQWLEERKIALPDQVYREEEIVVCVAKNKQFLGYFTLADSLREGAAEMVRFLQTKGKETLLISGDNERAVAAVAAQVGIEKQNAQVLPKTKAEIITNMRVLGHKVAMVGDGFNDIIALLQADVGIVFLSGKNTYHHWVDVLISRKDLYPLIDLFTINRRINRISRFNAVAACVLNWAWIEVLLFCYPGRVDWRWTLGGGLGIVLLVLFNSMRLLKIK